MASNPQPVGTVSNEPSRAEPVPYTPALNAHFRKTHVREEEFTLDVDFSAPAGFNIVFGSSGSGKTTLLDCIVGLSTPDTGSVRIGTRVLFDGQAGVHPSVRD